MKYAVKKELGIYAHFHPPVYRPLLPLINAALRLLPKRTQKGTVGHKLCIPTRDGSGLSALLISGGDTAKLAPCLVYFHGGGFAMEAAPSHYALASEYAKRTGCKVLLPKYRIAPKNAFPTPVNDCFDAYLWARENAEQLGVDVRRIAVGGDSAGGCLAAAVCLMARDAGTPGPCFQLLIYPVTDRRMKTESMRLYTDTPMWNARKNRRMWRWYMPEPARKNAEYASPAEAASLAELPNAYIETAEFDCLRDEGEEYAVLLQGAGASVELNSTHGTVHGYDAALNCGVTQQSVSRRVNALKSAFGASLCD